MLDGKASNQVVGFDYLEKIAIDNPKESKTTKTKTPTKDKPIKIDPNKCQECDRELSQKDKMSDICFDCGTELKGDQLRLD